MAQMPQSRVAMRPRPQANIYTMLLIVACLVLGATIGMVLWNLIDVYGLSFGEIFQAKFPT